MWPSFFILRSLILSGSWVKGNYQTSIFRKNIDILGNKDTSTSEKLSITLNVMRNLSTVKSKLSITLLALLTLGLAIPSLMLAP